MEDVKVVKKRGRKPKDKQTVSTQSIEEFVNTNMVLHIPLYDSTDKKIDNHSVCFQDENAPDEYLMPFDKNIMYMIEFNKESTEMNNYVNSNFSYTNTYRKVHDTNNFFDDNGCCSHQTKSDCVCFWCTEYFDTIPIGLPYKIVKNTDSNSESKFKYKYMVYGYFCGFGCMASYNFSLGDSQMNFRFNLINNLYEDVYNTIEPIVLAPPREMLKKFGGPYTIEQFRQMSRTNVQYQVIIPPIMSMKCQIEEFYGNINKKADTSVIQLDNERVNRAQNNIDKLRLKRNSSIHNSKNNIENRMGIKIINTPN